MKTPIVDFVENYIAGQTSRFHMPGHKGKTFLGCEARDITEIKDADVLSEALGIIGESEANAAELFGSGNTYYVTQGSTTAICAMLALVKKQKGRTKVLAARNVHKAFVHACVLLDIDAEWLMPEVFSNILECRVDGEFLEKKLATAADVAAVYITSPDYQGNIQDIRKISAVCKHYGVPLLVDNAHGAYLKFLDESLHPMDLGADMCCDSAHKTLPVLTGGAYLHVSKTASKLFSPKAREKIALFSSTSPSYLILQSLDLCNKYLSESYKNDLDACIQRVNELKTFLHEKKFKVKKTEPLKITVEARKSGYTGFELAEQLRNNGVEPEFCDCDFLVLMATPQNCEADYEKVENAFSKIEIRCEKKSVELQQMVAESVMSVREAVFSESEKVGTENCVGRVCAEMTVSCPPAIPIVISGEKITEEAVELFRYYGIDEISVVK